MHSFVTWNIHRCIGADGRYDPARIRRVLRALDADLYALQEVEVFHQDPDLLEYLCEDSDWRPIAGVTLTRESGRYGNAVLTRLPVGAERRVEISVRGREPRGVLELGLALGDTTCRVLTTHLGLSRVERRHQVRRLEALLEEKQRPRPGVTALLGDFNEWLSRGAVLRRLGGRFPHHPSPATFPARRPVFALDRIWIDGVHTLRLDAPRGAGARGASDHLPLRARFDARDD